MPESQWENFFSLTLFSVDTIIISISVSLVITISSVDLQAVH